MIKPISIAMTLLGLVIGIIIGVTRHYGVWTIGTGIAGGLIGWLTCAELSSYLDMIRTRRGQKTLK